MLKLVKHTSIHALQARWNDLYAANRTLTAYQDFAFCQVVAQYFRLSTRQWCTQSIYDFRNAEDQTVLLVPLHLRKTSQGTEAYLWGEFSQAGYLDAIYREDLGAETFRKALEAMTADIGDVTFRFTRVQERSRLNDLIRQSLRPNQYTVGSNPCVQIPINPSHEAYLQSLGKQYRRKAHISVNRLTTDHLTYEVKSCVNQPMPLLLLLRIFNLYWRRMEDKGIDFKLRAHLPYCLRTCLNPAIIALSRLPNTYYSIVHIEGRLAGFCAGFTSQDGRVILPFVAINSEFSRYSPGALLITESLKHLSENHSYRFFDLSRGDERYKFDYGGVLHNNLDYEIRLAGLPGTDPVPEAHLA